MTFWADIRRTLSIAAITLGSGAFASLAAAEPVKLTSLDWPPGTSPNLEGGGTLTKKLRNLLEEAGHGLEVTFLPWQRTVRTGLNDDSYVGYFPEYFSKDLDCLWSKPLAQSKLGFVKRAGSDFDWETVADLKPYRIGVVSGYVNDDGPFDAAIAAGELNVEGANNELLNLRKVARGRLDAAAMDKNIMEYLIRTEEPELKDDLAFDDKLLSTEDLLVCFQPDNPKAREVHEDLNAVMTD